MKTLVVWILALAAMATISLAQNNRTNTFNRKDAMIKAPTTSNGENVVSTGGSGLATSTSFIDASVFTPTGTPADNCTQISQAFTQASALGLTSVTIDARGITGSLNCASNPFSTASGMTGILLLGWATWTTSVQWQIPIRSWIDGIGLTSTANGALNSIVKAASTFSCTGGISMGSNCPVIFIGPTSGNVFAAGISHLTVDCNNLTNCVGVGSGNVQEGGGVDTVSFINQSTACVDFDSNYGGTIGIADPFIRNVNCTFGSNISSTAMGVIVNFKSGNVQPGPAEISNVTVTVPGGSGTVKDCLYLNGPNGTNVNYLHCEHATYAEVIGDSIQTAGVNIHGLTASSTTNGVWLKNAPAASVQGVTMSSGTALIDATNNITINSTVVGQYGVVPINVLAPNTLSGLTGLGTAVDGAVGYCSNCQSPSNPCAVTATTPGALAVHQNGAWVCK